MDAYGKELHQIVRDYRSGKTSAPEFQEQMLLLREQENELWERDNLRLISQASPEEPQAG